MKVLFLTNLPAPYTTKFFNEFGKVVELTVLYERKYASNQHESWKNFKVDNYKAIFLKGIKVKEENSFAPFVCRHLKKKYDAIIVGNFCSPTGMIAIFHMKFFRIPYILFSEGGFAKDGKGFKERLKKRIIRNARLYLSTSIPGDNYFLTYGALKERIRRIPFTSLYEKDILKYVFTKEQKNKLRSELNLPLDKKIIISVGRFVSVKAFEVLIKASKEIKTNHLLILAGDGPEKERYLEIIEKNQVKNVLMLGYMDKDLLTKYYEASDLFALPTRSDTWGLVIIEAMAKALPVITTTSCVAGIELIEKDVNGRLVEKDDVLLLAKNIDELLSNDSLLDKMSINNLEKIKFQTYENMVKIHMNILNAYINGDNK